MYILVYATEVNPSPQRQQILHVSLENGKVNNKSSGRQAITNAQIQSDLYQHGHFFPSGNAHQQQIAAHPVPPAQEAKPHMDTANPIPNVFHHGPAVGSEGWRSDRPQGLGGLNNHFPQPVLNHQTPMTVRRWLRFDLDAHTFLQQNYGQANLAIPGWNQQMQAHQQFGVARTSEQLPSNVAKPPTSAPVVNASRKKPLDIQVP